MIWTLWPTLPVPVPIGTCSNILDTPAMSTPTATNTMPSRAFLSPPVLQLFLVTMGLTFSLSVVKSYSLAKTWSTPSSTRTRSVPTSVTMVARSKMASPKTGTSASTQRTHSYHFIWKALLSHLTLAYTITTNSKCFLRLLSHQRNHPTHCILHGSGITPHSSNQRYNSKRTTFSDRLTTSWMNMNSANVQSAVYALRNLDLNPKYLAEDARLTWHLSFL